MLPCLQQDGHGLVEIVNKHIDTYAGVMLVHIVMHHL